MKIKLLGTALWGLSGVDYGKISSNKSFKLLSYALKKELIFLIPRLYMEMVELKN